MRQFSQSIFWTSDNFQQMMTSCKIRNSILHHAFWVTRKFHKSFAHYKGFFLSNSDSDNNHVTISKHWAEMTDEMTHSTPLKQHHRRVPPLCSKKCKLACIYYCQQFTLQEYSMSPNQVFRTTSPLFEKQRFKNVYW